MRPRLVEQVRVLATQLKGTQLAREQGLAYLDANCLREARDSFNSALEQSRSDSSPNGSLDRAFAKHALQLVSAYEALQAGHFEMATPILIDTSDESMPAAVNTRSVFALAEVLAAHPNSAAWDELQPKLSLLADNYHNWRARRLLLLHDLNADNATGRISEVERAVRPSQPVETQLELQMILAEILTEIGRLAEAELLLHDIERDVGRKVLPVDVRAYYVQVCFHLETRKAARGDAEANQRVAVYQDALRQLYDPQ